jgi:hypothetical protein
LLYSTFCFIYFFGFRIFLIEILLEDVSLTAVKNPVEVYSQHIQQTQNQTQQAHPHQQLQQTQTQQTLRTEPPPVLKNVSVLSTIFELSCVTASNELQHQILSDFLTLLKGIPLWLLVIV